MLSNHEHHSNVGMCRRARPSGADGIAPPPLVRVAEHADERTSSAERGRLEKHFRGWQHGSVAGCSFSFRGRRRRCPHTHCCGSGINISGIDTSRSFRFTLAIAIAIVIALAIVIAIAIAGLP
jgi:hypothetical protein